MPLDAHIIDSVTGQIDPELSTFMDVQQHASLFAKVGRQSDRFPLLSRMRDYYADADYTTNELESLIAEIEQIAALFEPGSSVFKFTGPFHSMCVMAFIRKKSVALYAD